MRSQLHVSDRPRQPWPDSLDGSPLPAFNSSTSLFPAIYERLPNDTDLTIFMDRGVAGLNFAFIGGVPHYHTPLDNLENLDLGSVQHQGEHFFAMARTLSNARLDELPEGNAVFFDVLGWFTVWWPQQWNLAIAVGVTVLAVLVLLLSLRESQRSVCGFTLGLFAWPLALIVTGLLGAGACQLVIAFVGVPVPWWSWPQPICVALWCMGIGVPVAISGLIRRRTSGNVSSAVVIMYWAVTGILLAWYFPGASYLFTVPTAIACGFRLFAMWRGSCWEAANLAFLVTACVLWLPLVRGLIDALGVNPSFAPNRSIGPDRATDRRHDHGGYSDLPVSLIGHRPGTGWSGNGDGRSNLFEKMAAARFNRLRARW